MSPTACVFVTHDLSIDSGPLPFALRRSLHDRNRTHHSKLLIFALFRAALLVSPGFSPTAWAQKPVPLINQPLVPEGVVPGGTGFTLRVNGTGFVPDSVVHWNGSARSTRFIDQGSLTATVLAADVVNVGPNCNKCCRNAHLGNEVTTDGWNASPSSAFHQRVCFEIKWRPRADSNCRHAV